MALFDNGVDNACVPSTATRALLESWLIAWTVGSCAYRSELKLAWPWAVSALVAQRSVFCGGAFENADAGSRNNSECSRVLQSTALERAQTRTQTQTERRPPAESMIGAALWRALQSAATQI